MWHWIVLAVAAGILAYIRLAPNDVARVHVPVTASEDKDGRGHAVRVLPASDGLLARVDAAMMADPATRRIAGSVAEGRITYVSRSKWFGFPDYTTIEETEGQVRMFGRSRFGRRDFGVNAARLKRVLAAVQR